MEFVVKEILFFTYVWFLGFSILILFGPYQSNSTKVIASRLWTPPTRPEQLNRPELDALLKVQRISNYTVYCTSMFYGFQTTQNKHRLKKLFSVNP